MTQPTHSEIQAVDPVLTNMLVGYMQADPWLGGRHGQHDHAPPTSSAGETVRDPQQHPATPEAHHCQEVAYCARRTPINVCCPPRLKKSVWAASTRPVLPPEQAPHQPQTWRPPGFGRLPLARGGFGLEADPTGRGCPAPARGGGTP